ncbi:MAG TPA: bifunctional precorrin-2 dehydrogenase/sirohydrochlorin ferrochelatase, partial [Dongiaceae bacterium]|nr:bifunctional precorrin-2 dehydrogenase/sirohydrochlorin ferrochelatase [Dongiaceae bacterium]
MSTPARSFDRTTADVPWPAAGEPPAADRALAAHPPLYPVALDLDGRLCLVVGGGVIARRKTVDLLAAGARVRVVAPEWRSDFDELEAAYGARIERRTGRFETTDAAGVALVIAATDDPVVQRAAWEAAAKYGLFCNVVDVTHLCSFQVPATVRRGALSVSVGTDGAFPLLAVALRDRIARLVGEIFAPAVERLAAARLRVRALHPSDAAARARALRDLLSPETVDALLAGDADQFAARAAAWEARVEAAASAAP